MKTDESCEIFSKIECKLLECQKKGVLIVTADSKVFIEAFFAAIHFEVPLFLGNPKWRENEWKQFFKQVNPALVFGEVPNGIRFEKEPAVADLKDFQKCIMIPTGGSTGKLRFAIHTWENLKLSAKATAQFLGKDMINSLCLLPLYHVSGLMQMIRASVTEGTVLFESLDSFDESHDFEGFCLSLVPTQLERFMNDSKLLRLLKTFDVIFLGGAAANEVLLERARKEKLPINLTYGMTETASMVAAMSSKDFLKGRKVVGSALTHADISINEENRIVIKTESLFYGYFPEIPKKKDFWVTDDEGIMNNGQLTVTGRADQIIITGGEKVDPKEVEAAILATGFVKTVVVKSKEDLEWGQKVVAIYVPAEDFDSEELDMLIKLKLKDILLNYKVPKEWIAVDVLPVDEKGKLVFDFSSM